MSTIAYAGKQTISISEVLAKLMKLNGGLNGSELADLVGLPSQTINRILSGFVKDPRGSTLIQVADYFGITVDQLLGKQPLPQELIAGNAEALQPSLVIPLISVNEAMLVKENPAKNTEWFRWPKNAFSTGQDNFAIRVIGKEYEPVFSNGTILVIDPGLEMQNDDWVLVKFKNMEQATIKKILLNQPGDYFLPIREGLAAMSFNEMPYEILGVVIEAHVDLRKKP